MKVTFFLLAILFSTLSRAYTDGTYKCFGSYTVTTEILPSGKRVPFLEVKIGGQVISGYAVVMGDKSKETLFLSVGGSGYSASFVNDNFQCE